MGSFNRFARRADGNQRSVAAALRRVGASVEYLHTVGKGVPDLLVGYQGRDFKIEMKDGTKSPAHRERTDAQVGWHASWRGAPALVARCEEEALCAIGAEPCRSEVRPCGCGGVADPPWFAALQTADAERRQREGRERGLEAIARRSGRTPRGAARTDKAK